jgi:hypothetical protein
MVFLQLITVRNIVEKCPSATTDPIQSPVVGLLDDFEQYILAFLRRFWASYLLVLVA